MDNMNFNEEIQDKEYFENKIQKLEARIKILEDESLAYKKWINASVTLSRALEFGDG